MQRIGKLFRDDPIYASIVSLVVVVAAWLLLTPVIPGVAMQTMRRFHLRSPNYPIWAAQFPIPAMYNFANRYRIANLQSLESEFGVMQLGDVESQPPTMTQPMTPWRYANHFPTRVITFADGRYRYLRGGQSHRFEFESRYRGQTLRSVYELQFPDRGDAELRLLDEPPAASK